ncbi:hypothetical protein LCGC14_0980060 [marine sediment metagenome]|uniref:Uncharacterized protein n=1 Tax=marine sediment metagenome TaxID=412755 RepID=A0A0F9NDJ3_9ZZZZ
MDYKDKSCANCHYGSHISNPCGLSIRRCYNLEKWVPNEAVKLSMIKKMMEEIIKLVDLV